MKNVLSSNNMPFQGSLKYQILQLCLKEQYAADLTVSVLYKWNWTVVLFSLHYPSPT